MLHAIDNDDSLNPHPDEAPEQPEGELIDPATEPVYPPDTATDPDPEMPAPTENDD